MLTTFILVQGSEHATPLLTGRREDGADHGVLERGHPLVLVDHRLVGELVVPRGRLDELALEVENAALTYL